MHQFAYLCVRIWRPVSVCVQCNKVQMRFMHVLMFVYYWDTSHTDAVCVGVCEV